MPAEPRLKVLYLAGNGRSGTTLLDIILGQIAGFCPVGEIRDVWEYAFRDNRICGCGSATQDCGIWQDVMKTLENDGEFSWQAMATWRQRFALTKNVLPMYLHGSSFVKRPEAQKYLKHLERLYHGMARATQSHVIVDSSKWPTYAFLLDQIDSIDLHVLHLVRDPRACAWSWQRPKVTGPGESLDRQSTLFSTLFWVVWNPATRALFRHRNRRYHFLRYEDFVQDPHGHVQKILAFLGEDHRDNPVRDDNRVSLSTTHSIQGNTSRFATGDLKIRADNKWRDQIPWASRVLVNVMTWPMLLKYGYWRTAPAAENPMDSSK